MTTTNEILAALERELEVYRRLSKLANVQHEHVQAGRTEDLLRVLGQRQAALEELAALEQTLAPAKGRWTDFLAELSEDRRAAAEALLAQSRQLLEEITASDRNDALALQQRKLNLGKQIAQATAARHFNNRYAAAAYGQRRPALDTKR